MNLAIDVISDVICPWCYRMDAINEAQELSGRHRVDGVPCFIINNEITLSGAQQPDALLAAFRAALGSR
jgi:predicted DsbA family dithiol-disulfide isomerase